MSYSEENGLVVLRMSREDYERLLIFLGMATGVSMQRGRPVTSVPQILAFVNRLNEGNPKYTPYQVEAKK